MSIPKNINSTIDEPIRFFLNYSESVRNILDQDYKKLNGLEEYYDLKANVAFRMSYVHDEEGLVITNPEEFPFEQYISDIFDYELLNSKALITEFYKNNKSNSDNEFAYKKLLRAFVDKFEKFKNYPSYPESELLPSALLSVIEHAMFKYRGLYNFPLQTQARKIIEKENNINISTGFELKSQYKIRINVFNDLLISGSFISPETKTYQWNIFFNGRIPSKTSERINWIADDKHLFFFIQELINSDLLDNPPYHKFKHLPKIFLLKGNELNPEFYKNHNYLNRKDKQKIKNILHSLKSK